MKKILIPLIVIIVIVVAVMLLGSSGSEQTQVSSTSKADPVKATTSEQTDPGQGDLDEYDDEDEYDYDIDIQPATDVYTSADEAFQKVLEASKEYDDLVLEQFAELDDSCAWCPEFYNQVKETMLSSTDENEKSYLAELLAITGKVDNLETILSAYEGTDKEDDKDIYLEALEFTAGDDQLVEYLNGKLETEDELLKESLVAAITNHGSRLAVESLYEQTVKSGDSDGFYALGIGIGEVIPDEGSLPFIVEKAKQPDQYSHLFIKALLNYGDDGLREVVNIISNTNDTALNQQRLEDAIDHVTYDEETQNYLKQVVETTDNPDAKKFAEEVLEDMALEYDYDEEDEEDY